MGFSFSQGLAFSLALTMLASIIVGVTATIFQSIMGYDDFVQGYIGRIDELVQLIKENSATDVEMPADFEEMRDGVRAMEQPSMLSNIYATMSNYVFMGFIICSIVSLIVRRRAVYINNSQNEK
jgi:predicted PurR-regulated permease PerM